MAVTNAAFDGEANDKAAAHEPGAGTTALGEDSRQGSLPPRSLSTSLAKQQAKASGVTPVRLEDRSDKVEILRFVVRACIDGGT